MNGMANDGNMRVAMSERNSVNESYGFISKINFIVKSNGFYLAGRHATKGIQ